MKKRVYVTAAAAILTALWCQTAFAGQWVEDPSRPANENGRTNWWYQRDDGTYPAGGWEWLDGNGDGTAESYRFDENGWMYASTTVDGYAVNENGAWVENGEYPADWKALEKMVRGVCYNNAVEFFSFPLEKA